MRESWENGTEGIEELVLVVRVSWSDIQRGGKQIEKDYSNFLAYWTDGGRGSKAPGLEDAQRVMERGLFDSQQPRACEFDLLRRYFVCWPRQGARDWRFGEIFGATGATGSSYFRRGLPQPAWDQRADRSEFDRHRTLISPLRKQDQGEAPAEYWAIVETLSFGPRAEILKPAFHRAETCELM